ncbi:MAG: MFS transporter [Candidatus Enterosoma sp.]|nr:MFS transporter [Bacilli bacterium]MDD7617705.1 MFS transporter [bacterium]MDY2895307.1 MFS transporter [Candidatus Enterosoma sp.]MDD7707441.1 MFS transporter [bacterium]MDY3210746.1 MFS transporter [Candidatus Enterosoma sp.]
MTILLLLLIYLVFISLGLPDSLLGSSFPAIAENLAISVDHAGYIGMTVSLFTILSSAFSDKLVEKLSTKVVISLSILLTALGLIGFSTVRENTFFLFYVYAIPLGLGAGAIDSSLNNYVALHYKAIHMNWLHCAWGVGASISPLIAGAFIQAGTSKGWDKGVLTVAIIQLSIALLSFIAFPLWKRAFPEMKREEEKKEEKTSKKSLFTNPIFYLSIFAFFCYSGLESSCGLWSSSFFCYHWNTDTQKAANLTSLFYFGITAGRFLCGPLSLKMKEKNIIRLGETLMVLGGVLMTLNFSIYLSIVGVALFGFGCAPIFPAFIRLTPYRFSTKLSQSVMGLQMALAYCGTDIISPVYGYVSKTLGNQFFTLPYLLLFLTVVMIILSETCNRLCEKRDQKLTDKERSYYVLDHQ